PPDQLPDRLGQRRPRLRLLPYPAGDGGFGGGGEAQPEPTPDCRFAAAPPATARCRFAAARAAVSGPLPPPVYYFRGRIKLIAPWLTAIKKARLRQAGSSRERWNYGKRCCFEENDRAAGQTGSRVGGGP